MEVVSEHLSSSWVYVLKVFCLCGSFSMLLVGFCWRVPCFGIHECLRLFSLLSSFDFLFGSGGMKMRGIEKGCESSSGVSGMAYMI